MADSQRGVLSTLQEIIKKPYSWGIVAIIALLCINVLQDPGYLAISVNQVNGNLVGNVLDILRAAAPILMIAVGMCLVIATSGIDLSVGSVMAVGGAVSMEVLRGIGQTDSMGAALAALGLAIGLSALLGMANGFLVAVVRLQPFITTLIMMMAGRGIARVITGGQNTAASNDQFRWIANGYVFGLPVIVIIAFAIVILVALIVRKTALGLMIEAIGINETASRMAGIKPRGLLITVYAISGALAGMGGVFATATVMTVDVSRTGYLLELDAILAVVIGGTALAGGKFSLGGAVVGALLIATLDKTVVFLGIPSSATPAFKAAIIIIICLAQSTRVREYFAARRRPVPTRAKERAA
ncbi:ABC transporter permease [Microbacterium amylolyticum]